MKEKEPLLAPDDLLNLGAVGESENDFEAGRPKLIAFLPAVRPIRECALTYRDYQSLTDGSRFRPPFRPLLEVDERLVLSDPDDGEELCGEIELGDENPENPDYEDTNEDDLQDPEELAQIRDNERLSSW
jgi:hypothetical protein